MAEAAKIARTEAITHFRMALTALKKETERDPGNIRSLTAKIQLLEEKVALVTRHHSTYLVKSNQTEADPEEWLTKMQDDCVAAQGDAQARVEQLTAETLPLTAQLVILWSLPEDHRSRIHRGQC